jgi:hypothetical protein
MPSLKYLKHELAREKQEHARKERALTRLRNVKKWARKVGLDYLVRRLDSAIDDTAEKKAESAGRIKKLERRIKNYDPPAGDVPPMVDGGWHPGAQRTQVQNGIGAMMNVPAKLVWHTTEGSSLPAYSGSHPHFTLNPQSGALYQHISVKSGAMALRNLSGGAETNRANAIQVELIGFASQTQNWSDAAYANIAELARWIEKHCGVARECHVTFQGSGGPFPKLSVEAWYAYRGHLGHQDVPEQDHWDPGAFKIGLVI